MASRAQPLPRSWPTSASKRRGKARALAVGSGGLEPAGVRAVFKAGALDVKTKQLLAVAVAHVTQCPHCIRGHSRAALKAGASQQESMEAIWVAAEMRAGGSHAHSSLALDVMNEVVVECG